MSPALMARAGMSLIFFADMHQGHDQEIGKEVAPLVMGEHNQRFQNSLDFVEGQILRKLLGGDTDVLINHSGSLISEIYSAQTHIVMKKCRLGLTLDIDDLTSPRRSVTVAVQFLAASTGGI